MASGLKSKLPIVQTRCSPAGTEAFEQVRKKLVDELCDSIPKEYHLPKTIIDQFREKDKPTDVTGIPATCGILTEKELSITEDYDATSLADAIASKQLTAVEVAKAFCKRAAIAHQLTCCLTEYFQDEAIERAKQLDEYLATHGKTVGPLHGVPVSVKEHMALAGHFSAYGYLSTRVRSEKDSLMVQILRDAGAVFYVKTNQPQSIMHLETDSWWGRTNNPHNINLSSGGSTGGESALIAMNASVLGLGTDIGGSVRGPSAFCGIVGFKPTTYTVTLKDFLPGGFPAELNVLCSTGPMCRTFRDADLFMRVLVGAKQYLHDPRIVPLPWTGLKTPMTKPLKIGIMLNDGVITPQPPVLKALHWVQGQLSNNANFVLKPFKPYRADEAMRLIGQMYWPDVGLNTKKALAATGEPMSTLTKVVLSPVTSDFENPNGPEKEKTATEITQMRIDRDEYRAAFIEHWECQDVDYVIAPCFVGPASKHDTAFYWNYTALWNFVDYPGIVLPTPIKVEVPSLSDKAPISVQADELRKFFAASKIANTPVPGIESSQPEPLKGADKLPISVQADMLKKHFGGVTDVSPTEYAPDYKPLSEKCQHVRDMWDQGGFENAPINIQVVARRFHDNQLFGAVEEMQPYLQFK
ncbi:putative amidase [Pseudocercospora fuligena]|uniref:Putative amidase n=1 Tax=Pseudocercospora fuligena TaxID=685502 RepID=A0A8H6RH24_9PEZI|nr:putative amidase [Pseudocercospora fuligena]